MYSEKRTLFGAFLFFLILIVSVVLCVFSISNALEAEVAEPAAPEEAVTEVVTPEEGTPEEALPTDPVAEEPKAETPAVAEEPKADGELAETNESVGGPLRVLKNGVDATTEDCTWDASTYIYSIKSNGLTFAQRDSVAECSIITPNGSSVNDLTLDNVSFTSYGTNSGINPLSSGNFVLNIKGNCSISSSGGNGVIAVHNGGQGDTFVVNGVGSSSSFNVTTTNNYSAAIRANDFDTVKFTGDITANFSSAYGSGLHIEADSLIFDTTGKIVISAPNAEAIYGSSQSFNLSVNKGYVALHGISNKSGYTAALLVGNADVDNIIQMGSNVKMLGSKSTNAELADCKEGVYMLSYSAMTNAGGGSFSCIDNDAAGTVIFTDSLPTPGGGSEASETAKTGDNIPDGVLALMVVIAFAGFAVLRSRKYTF